MAYGPSAEARVVHRRWAVSSDPREVSDLCNEGQTPPVVLLQSRGLI